MRYMPWQLWLFLLPFIVAFWVVYAVIWVIAWFFTDGIDMIQARNRRRALPSTR